MSKSNSGQPDDIDSYITTFPEETQTTLRKIRAIINEVAPHTVESISYGSQDISLTKTD